MPNYTQLIPVAFAQMETAERDALPPIDALTIFNYDGDELQVFINGRWCNIPLYRGTRHDGDVMTWRDLNGLWVPSSDVNVIGTLSGTRVFVHKDATDALEVKRTFSGLTKTGTGTGEILLFGDHTHASNINYRVVIDTAGLAGDVDSATFKWSIDGGATFVAEGVSLSDNSRIPLQNGVFVTFTAGSYEVDDRWDWVAIATGSQLYDLKVDTTNSRVYVGIEVRIANDDEFRLYKFSDTVCVLEMDTGTGWYYDRILEQWSLYVNGVDVIESIKTTRMTMRDQSVIDLGNYASTPATPSTGKTALFSRVIGGVSVPHMKDDGGTIRSLAPLTTKGDIYTFSTVPIRKAVGANKLSIIADSAEAVGWKWGSALTTDTLWNAFGDLVVGLGDDSADILPVGLNNQVPTADDNAMVGISYQYPITPARSITPEPSMPSTSTAASVILPAVGTGVIGHVCLTAPITVTQLRYNVAGAGVGGTCTVRCVVYQEDGQVLLINVTEALNTGTGVRTITLGAAVYLKPGNYYFGVGLSATTHATQPSVSVWSTNDTYMDGGASQLDLEGTVTWTAGAAPSTFNPEADITATADRVPFFNLQNT